MNARADEKGVVVGIDGLSSRAPAEWKEAEMPRQFRFKEFSIPGEGGEKAELIIFYFGEGSGGGVDENVKRWKGMFEPAAGKKIDDVAKVEKMKVGNVNVTYLDVSGTYLYKPFPMAPQAEKRPNHRMISVVFESPKGPYFFRLVGPEKIVTANKAKFDEWLKNFK
jgi:hypothetical protein